MIDIRPARQDDVTALVRIENACFETDRLSTRSFHNFIKPGPHRMLVALTHSDIAGYVLVLYRRGTNLARIYSIAVAPQCQGRGIARKLVEAAEVDARERHCVYMRLEVRTDNESAIGLYQSRGYKLFDRIEDYYEDGCDALRMEKRVHQWPGGAGAEQPYYEQTTDFTCGPASLMMAMRALDNSYVMSKREELQIWREATTIFMTSGHGGCSPHGLALSAWRRGFKATLYINQASAPFIDSVRDPDKKEVLELVHEDFLAQIAEADVDLQVTNLNASELRQILASGKPVVALVSNWSLTHSKSPHWVYVAGSDDDFVYINDPDTEDFPWQSNSDYIRVPISLHSFARMATYGRTRLRSLVVLDRKP